MIHDANEPNVVSTHPPGLTYLHTGARNLCAGRSSSEPADMAPIIAGCDLRRHGRPRVQRIAALGAARSRSLIVNDQRSGKKKTTNRVASTEVSSMNCPNAFSSTVVWSPCLSKAEAPESDSFTFG